MGEDKIPAFPLLSLCASWPLRANEKASYDELEVSAQWRDDIHKPSPDAESYRAEIIRIHQEKTQLFPALRQRGLFVLQKC